MVEGEMKEISEEMLEAIKFHEHIKTKFQLNYVCKLLFVKRSLYV
jgi:hypothetical protein